MVGWDVGPQGKHSQPLPPYQLTPMFLPLDYNCGGPCEPTADLLPNPSPQQVKNQGQKLGSVFL